MKSLKEGVPDKCMWINILSVLTSRFPFLGTIVKYLPAALNCYEREKKMLSVVTEVSYCGGY